MQSLLHTLFYKFRFHIVIILIKDLDLDRRVRVIFLNLARTLLIVALNLHGCMVAARIIFHDGLVFPDLVDRDVDGRAFFTVGLAVCHHNHIIAWICTQLTGIMWIKWLKMWKASGILFSFRSIAVIGCQHIGRIPVLIDGVGFLFHRVFISERAILVLTVHRQILKTARRERIAEVVHLRLSDGDVLAWLDLLEFSRRRALSFIQRGILQYKLGFPVVLLVKFIHIWPVFLNRHVHVGPHLVFHSYDGCVCIGQHRRVQIQRR